MEYIKSKFTGSTIIWGIVILIMPVSPLIYVISEIIKEFSGTLDDYFGLLLFGGLLFLMLNIYKFIRYIVIKGDRLTYYSLFCPWGRTLYFKDYVGKIIIQETNFQGKYNAVHLIDKKNRTAFRITGLNYRNFDQINNSIPLENIDFNPTKGEYWKLMFLGRITIKQSSINKSENKKLNKMLVVIQIIVVVGLLLLIIGYLLRWIFG